MRCRCARGVPTSRRLPPRRARLPPRQATLPSRRETLRSRRETLPSRRATLPSRRATLPSRRATLPSRRATLPSRRATLPSWRATLPSRRATLPPRREDAPVEEGDAPVEEGDAPVEEGDAPVEEGDAPVEEGDAPVEEGDAPVEEGDTPIEEGDTPTSPPVCRHLATTSQGGSKFVLDVPIAGVMLPVMTQSQIRRLRAIIDLDKEKVAELSEGAKIIQAKMTASAAIFTAPVPAMPALASLITLFDTAHLNTKSTKAAIAARNFARDNLWSALQSECSYVQQLCDQNPEQAATYIEAAGLKIAGTPAHAKAILEAELTTTPGAVHLIANRSLLVAPGKGSRSAKTFLVAVHDQRRPVLGRRGADDRREHHDHGPPAADPGRLRGRREGLEGDHRLEPDGDHLRPLTRHRPLRREAGCLPGLVVRDLRPASERTRQRIVVEPDVLPVERDPPDRPHTDAARARLRLHVGWPRAAHRR